MLRPRLAIVWRGDNPIHKHLPLSVTSAVHVGLADTDRGMWPPSSLGKRARADTHVQPDRPPLSFVVARVEAPNWPQPLVPKESNMIIITCNFPLLRCVFDSSFVARHRSLQYSSPPLIHSIECDSQSNSFNWEKPKNIKILLVAGLPQK